MKIIFLCGSIEPGKDGVGDYTRRLCGELIRKGNKVEVLALCDNHQRNFSINEIQEVEQTSVLVHRIPFSTSNKQRFIWTEEILDKLQPDCISLQYVPYSFHIKGMPFWLPSFLKRLKGNHQWHIMFHELWLGIEREIKFKNKCVGFLQKRIIRKLNESLAPSVFHTQSKVYQYYLSKIDIESIYLPLFGNVPVTACKKNNSELILFVVFATIHNNAPFENFILDLKKELKYSNKILKFLFIGRNGELLHSWILILEKYEIKYEILGALSEEYISEILKNGDYGISSTPYKISDKSGVVAAMKEHQLPIICVAKDWVDQEDVPISFRDIIQYKNRIISLNKSSVIENNSLVKVSESFFKSIDNKLFLRCKSN